MKIRHLWMFAAVFLPLPIKLSLYRRLLGWEIEENVKIGFSYIESDHVIIGKNAVIGNLNIIRCVKFFHMGADSSILNLNQFFGCRNDLKWPGKLIIGRSAHIMSHHFIDVNGQVIIGNNTVIGGRDTHFWSHGLTYASSEPELTAFEIMIGENVYIGARSTLIGCCIPDNDVVGAGSVVTKQFPEENCRFLIAGNPATVKKRYETTLNSSI